MPNKTIYMDIRITKTDFGIYIVFGKVNDPDFYTIFKLFSSFKNANDIEDFLEEFEYRGGKEKDCLELRKALE